MKPITLHDTRYDVVRLDCAVWTLRATSRYNLFDYDPSDEIRALVNSFEDHENLLGLFTVTYDVFNPDKHLPPPRLEHAFVLRHRGERGVGYTRLDDRAGEAMFRVHVSDGLELTEQYQRVRRLLALIGD